MKTEIQKRIGALALLALLTLCLRPSTTFAQAWGNFVLSSSPIVGNQPNSVVTVDVNGDGKVDLICANGLDNTLSVLTNDGSGDFTLASTLNVGGFPYGVAAADVNGDGKMDLICGNPNANALTVLTNDGSGGFAIASTPAAGIQAEYPIAADVNGDGKVDLVCANASSISSANTITVLTNDGSGNFTLASALTVGSNPRWVTA
ncbi:MAG: VCBS repeat-containing protein, partial [Verrucomicrobiota bacterium]|nr:VCBS repeat-containing protein [Verrucomicrobiota bacterium]